MSSNHSRRLLALTAAALLGGCRQDMHDQPKFIPLRESDFYSDHRSARPIVDNTVPRGLLREDDLLETGKVNGQPATDLPFPVTGEVLARGQERRGGETGDDARSARDRAGRVEIVVHRGFESRLGGLHLPGQFGSGRPGRQTACGRRQGRA